MTEVPRFRFPKNDEMLGYYSLDFPYRCLSENENLQVKVYYESYSYATQSFNGGNLLNNVDSAHRPAANPVPFSNTEDNRWCVL